MTEIVAPRVSPKNLLAATLAALTLVVMPAVTRDSVTVDEPDHLMAGLTAWTTGDLTVGCEHPPLARMWAAAPVALFSRPEIPVLRPHAPMQDLYEGGVRTLFHLHNPTERMLSLGRGMVWILVCLSAWLIYRWSARLFGERAGLLSAFVFVFNPGILAHGRLITTDMGGAFGYLLATWSIARWASEGTWPNLVLSAGCMALAFCLKLNTLPILFVFPIAAALSIRNGSVCRSSRLKILAETAATGCAASVLLVGFMWVLYGFQFGRIGPILDPFFDEIGVGIERIRNKLPALFASPFVSVVEKIPVPFPAFFAGLITLGSLKRTAFLAGSLAESGWWYYLPFAFLVKTPIPLLALMVTGIGQAIHRLRNHPNRTEIVILLAASAAYWIVGCAAGWSSGYRHLLPVLPVQAVLTGGLIGAHRLGSRKKTSRRVERFAWGLILLTVLELGIVYPRYLSYFNLLAGGNAGGYRYLIDSNVDWGQDIRRLAEYLEHHNLDFAYGEVFNPDSLGYYGVDLRLPGSPEEASKLLDQGEICIVSANVLQGLTPEWKTRWRFLRTRPYGDRIGDSLFVYGNSQ